MNPDVQLMESGDARLQHAEATTVDTGIGRAHGSRASMRVQLQEQRNRRTIHHASVPLFDRTGSGVTSAQVIEALRQLRHSGLIPRGQHFIADAALDRAVRFVLSRPPTGISQAVSKSFYFNPHTPGNSWRFDIENIVGTNLVQ